MGWLILILNNLLILYKYYCYNVFFNMPPHAALDCSYSTHFKTFYREAPNNLQFDVMLSWSFLLFSEPLRDTTLLSSPMVRWVNILTSDHPCGHLSPAGCCPSRNICGYSWPYTSVSAALLHSIKPIPQFSSSKNSETAKEISTIMEYLENT